MFTRVAILATDWPSYEQFCPNFTGMIKGLDNLGITNKLFSVRPFFPSIDTIVEFNPDLIVYGLLDIAKNWKFRKELRQAIPNAKIVFWYGDYRDKRHGQISVDMSEIDMMFVSNNGQNGFYEDIWRVKKCNYLPLGSQIYNADVNPKLSFDFVFLGSKCGGTGFVDRALAISELERNEGLKVINASATSQSKLRAKIMEHMPSIYRSSKVCLDISHFTDVDKYTSNRHWIITASGGFSLTKRFPGCEEDYPIGTRVYFDTRDEMVKLKNYYIEHEDEREKIRLAGFEHAKNHTYENRFKRMFDML